MLEHINKGCYPGITDEMLVCKCIDEINKHISEFLKKTPADYH